MKQPTQIAAVLLMALTSSVVLAQQEGQGGASKAPASKAHLLTNAELDKLLEHPEKVILIDVRRPDEVSSVGGFPVYLSIQLKELGDSVKWIPKDRAIVTVSNHAGRAAKAADLLAGKGFNVAGAVGAQTYEKAGGTIAHIAVPPPRAANGQGAGGQGAGQKQDGAE